MSAIEAQIVTAGRVARDDQDAFIDANPQQVARGLAGETTTKAILGVERIADKIGDAAHRAPRPMAVDVVQELDKARLLRLDGPLRRCIVVERPRGPQIGAAATERATGEPQWNELLRGADEVPADGAGHTYHDDALVEAELEASADAREVAVAAHQDKGVYAGAVEDRFDDIHQHVQIDGALRDDGLRSLIVLRVVVVLCVVVVVLCVVVVVLCVVRAPTTLLERLLAVVARI